MRESRTSNRDLAGLGMHVTDDCGIKILPRSADETAELMAQALEGLCQDSELRAKMGPAGRARAEQVYSWDHLGERLLSKVWGVLSQEA